MNQKSEDEKPENLVPKVSRPKVTQAETLSSHIMSEVRCPHILENKHTGKKFKCNYKAMELEFGKGTTKCRNCRQIFSFEVNTTHVRFIYDDTVGQNPIDILE